MTKSSHADELIEGKHWVVRNTYTPKGGTQKTTMWTKRGIIRLGNFIKTEMGKKFRDWAEDYCIKVFNTGKAMQGYALWLAKTEVHKEKQVGFQAFCKKVGLSVSNSNRLIAFYEAKKVLGNQPTGGSIPNASTYAELKGKTPQEKAQNYSDIKKSGVILKLGS